MTDPRSESRSPRVPPARRASGKAAGRRTGGSAQGRSIRGTSAGRSSSLGRTEAGRGVPWSRRLGAATGLVVVTATIALAGSGTLDIGSRGVGRASPTPSATGPSSPTDPASPSPALPSLALGTAPTIVRPPAEVTRESTIMLTVELPEEPEARMSVRLYRAERVIATARVRGSAAVELRDVPLKRGENVIAATVLTPNGESPRSASIVIDRDDTPPHLTIQAPVASSVVNAPSVEVRGVSEPGAAVTATGVTRQESVPVTVAAEVAEDGSFAATVELAEGPNQLTLRATDTAGNKTIASLMVIGGDGRPEARLALSSSVFYIRRLPQTVSLSVHVVDADGITVDSAAVVFSLSPPGQPTSTYRTTVVNGVATWPSVSLPQGGAQPGDGFATAQVTLTDGSILRAVTSFEFR